MSNIEELLEEATSALTACDDIRALDDLRVQYLGKKGLFTEQLKSLGKLSAEERPQAGQAINAAKKQFQQLLESRKAELEGAAIEAKLAAEKIDVTLPGRGLEPGGYTRSRSPCAVLSACLKAWGSKSLKVPRLKMTFIISRH